MSMNARTCISESEWTGRPSHRASNLKPDSKANLRVGCPGPRGEMATMDSPAARHSAVVVEDLIQGLNEWRNIQVRVVQVRICFAVQRFASKACHSIWRVVETFLPLSVAFVCAKWKSILVGLCFTLPLVD